MEPFVSRLKGFINKFNKQANKLLNRQTNIATQTNYKSGDLKN